MAITPQIKVIVRKRPLSERETKNDEIDVMDISDHKTVTLCEQKKKVDALKKKAQFMLEEKTGKK